MAHPTHQSPADATPERQPSVSSARGEARTRILRISSIKPYTSAGTDLLSQLPVAELAERGWRIVWNAPVERCDAWLIFDGVTVVESGNCPRENVMYMTAEPSAYKIYPEQWLAQFPKVTTWQRGMRHPNKIHSHVPLPWFVKRNRADLLGMPPSPKTRDFSGFCSSQSCMKGHHRRLDCVARLKRRFGDRIEWYGRNIRFIEDKWDGLAPFRFSFALENSREHDYWTEKLVDCFLTRTIPLYDGAPNLADYFPEGSFIPINMEDHEGIVRLVEKLSLDPAGEYEARREALEKARTLCLGSYSLGGRILAWCDSLSDGLPDQPHHFLTEPKLPWMQRKVMQFRRRWLGRL